MCSRSQVVGEPEDRRALRRSRRRGCPRRRPSRSAARARRRGPSRRPSRRARRSSRSSRSPACGSPSSLSGCARMLPARLSARSTVVAPREARSVERARAPAMCRVEPAPTQTISCEQQLALDQDARRRAAAGTARRAPGSKPVAATHLVGARDRARSLRPRPRAIFAASARRSPGTSASTGAPSQTKTSDLTICAELAADRLRRRPRRSASRPANSSIRASTPLLAQRRRRRARPARATGSSSR